MITAAVESLTERLPEIQPLLPKHWEELALDKDKVPLDPQYEIYLDRDRRGEVLFVTLREAGKLIGYFVGFVAPGLHYRTCLTCQMDIFWIDPKYRGRRAGFKMFRYLKEELQRRGVQRWTVGSKKHMDASWLFEAMGFEAIETHYSMWIGDENG